jgi:hypothetical protein
MECLSFSHKTDALLGVGFIPPVSKDTRDRLEIVMGKFSEHSHEWGDPVSKYDDGHTILHATCLHTFSIRA